MFPGTSYGVGEERFAVAFAVPRDVEGLTIVETRRPSDTRDEEEGWDSPKVGAITQAWLLFDDVFVPRHRVFLCGEVGYTAQFVSIFSAIYRSAIGACVAGQGDVMIGAALALARANGLSRKTFQEKLTQMTVNNEVTFGIGLGAMLVGKQHPSGVFVPDPLLAHVNKVQVARLPYETKVLAQDISGGIAETGCLPSFRNMRSPEYGDRLLAAAAGAADGETRARLARLVEWLTVGGGVPGCMHGGGSPDGARLAIRGLVDWEAAVTNARRSPASPASCRIPADPFARPRRRGQVRRARRRAVAAQAAVAGCSASATVGARAPTSTGVIPSSSPSSRATAAVPVAALVLEERLPDAEVLEHDGLEQRVPPGRVPRGDRLCSEERALALAGPLDAGEALGRGEADEVGPAAPPGDGADLPRRRRPPLARAPAHHRDRAPEDTGGTREQVAHARVVRVLGPVERHGLLAGAPDERVGHPEDPGEAPARASQRGGALPERGRELWQGDRQRERQWPGRPVCEPQASQDALVVAVAEEAGQRAGRPGGDELERLELALVKGDLRQPRGVLAELFRLLLRDEAVDQGSTVRFGQAEHDVLLPEIRSRGSAAAATGAARGRPREIGCGMERGSAGARRQPGTVGRDQPRTGAPDGWRQMHDACSAASRVRQMGRERIIAGDASRTASGSSTSSPASASSGRQSANTTKGKG